MKIYTRTGDHGETALFSGGRVPKYHLRIEAVGTVDEINSTLGLAHSLNPGDALRPILESVQRTLFVVGAQMATPDRDKLAVDPIEGRDIVQLETWIDQLEETLPPLTQFILPGGTAAASALHQARSVCRRAERILTRIHSELPDPPPGEPLVYLNRLSDLLFVMARTANLQAEQSDRIWEGRRSKK
ncbi:MAG: cob(I)yrinic acid a,c-diamide adenosyltransferase [Balneolaceae bacterium]